MILNIQIYDESKNEHRYDDICKKKPEIGHMDSYDCNDCPQLILARLIHEIFIIQIAFEFLFYLISVQLFLSFFLFLSFWFLSFVVFFVLF